jgi:dTDP-4-amino-4,6-dideoxygalactose transaminase
VANRDAWQRFAAENGLLLIEDAAHATGAEFVGTFGHAAAFSFYGNKNMTTAEGGAIIASDPAVLEHIRTMRGHGMTTGTFQRYTSKTVNYDVTMLGYNYRMDELRAAIGLTQLRHLAEWNDRRKSLTRLYVQLLEERCPRVEIPFKKFIKLNKPPAHARRIQSYHAHHSAK